MQTGAHCARHAERPAALACARCGTFICTGCVVSGDLCAPCKSRLLKEGVPYSVEERARASARSWLRIGSWTQRIELGAGGGSALILAGSIGGIFPAGLRSLGLGLGALAIVLGVVAAFAAVLGYRRSLRGRPGPAG